MNFLRLVFVLIASIYVFLSVLFVGLLLVLPTSIKHLVFLHQRNEKRKFFLSKRFVLVKTGTNFRQPESLNLTRVFNFYLDVEPNVRLGIWFVVKKNNFLHVFRFVSFQKAFPFAVNR